MSKKSFAKALRDARKANRLTFEALARKSGVSMRTLFRIEAKATRSPGEATIRRIASVLPELAPFVPIVPAHAA